MKGFALSFLLLSLALFWLGCQRDSVKDRAFRTKPTTGAAGEKAGEILATAPTAGENLADAPRTEEKKADEKPTNAHKGEKVNTDPSPSLNSYLARLHLTEGQVLKAEETRVGIKWRARLFSRILQVVIVSQDADHALLKIGYVSTSASTIPAGTEVKGWARLDDDGLPVSGEGRVYEETPDKKACIRTFGSMWLKLERRNREWTWADARYLAKSEYSKDHTELPSSGLIAEEDANRFNSSYEDPWRIYLTRDTLSMLVLTDSRVGSAARDAPSSSSSDITRRRKDDVTGADALITTPGNWPKYSGELRGAMEVRVRNPNDFIVRVGLRSRGQGRDFLVAANRTESVRVPNGRYDVFFQYSTDPNGLYQGDSFTLNDNGVEIQIVKVVNGNYGIRKVK